MLLLFTKFVRPNIIICRNSSVSAYYRRPSPLTHPSPQLSVLDTGLNRRLPESYKKFYREWKLTPPEKPVHYIPEEAKYKKDPQTNKIYRVHSIPIPTVYSEQEDLGLWGGEGIIEGYKRLLKVTGRTTHDLGRCPKYWYPNLLKTVIYSEILDQNMVATVTHRVIRLINEHAGLDHYLLQTKACDLRNLLAVRLKRKVLHSLWHKTLYPNDEKKRQEVYDEYKTYLDGYTEEDIEWYGLTLAEAQMKNAGIRRRLEELPKVPLKIQYRQDLLNELRKEGSSQQDEKEPWYKKKLYLPFSKS